MLSWQLCATIASTFASESNVEISWGALHTAYAKNFETRIFIHRERLARLSKDSHPVANYLHQVRALCDELPKEINLSLQ